MTNQIDYSIVNDETGSIVVRSKIKSFNLDHVTDKDILSFYRNFSSYALVDTGILPLQGTGILSIRSAGEYTQITFQHAPQISYINWGTYEGDSTAKTYGLAQPYRIWIADLYKGTLLGARMFYSPYPITNPNAILYHVNLPNTNCKGYRGNGVGWQCLYHKEDMSDLPFNEKVVRIAERCSGVETFNDQNMSETDGPRFYQDHYKYDSEYAYLWNPDLWQAKTFNEGIDWTLDENIWIPIKVTSMDDQKCHNDEGEYLTLKMAMLGDYRAYYTDDTFTKPVNAFAREDKSIDANTVFDWVKISYNNSLTKDKNVNPIDLSEVLRNKFVENPLGVLQISSESEDNEEDEDNEEENFNVTINCPLDGHECVVHEDNTNVDSEDNVFCENCFCENVVHVQNTDQYLLSTHPDLIYIENSDVWIDKTQSFVANCTNCDAIHWKNIDEENYSQLWTNTETGKQYCSYCVNLLNEDQLLEENTSLTLCSSCLSNKCIIGPGWQGSFSTHVEVYNLNGSPITVGNYYCYACSPRLSFCPTGHYFTKTFFNPYVELPFAYNEVIEDSENGTSVTAQITHLCRKCCANQFYLDSINELDIENISKQQLQSSLLKNYPFKEEDYQSIHDNYVYSVIKGIAQKALGFTIQE